MTDDLTEENIAAELRGRWGRPLRVFRAVGSTNDEALSWAHDGAPEGAVVVADHQTAGRGRRGRAWLSQPGRSLLFSLVLKPRPAAELGLLSTAVGVACASAVEKETGLRIGLKWPNDLVAGGRKIGGILVETRVAGSAVDVAVVGVGINFFDLSRAPVEVVERSSSLAAETVAAGIPGPPGRAGVLASILDALERLYPGLDPSTILEQASARSDILGRNVTLLRADGATIVGRAVSLLPSGALELATAGGSVAVTSGEVATLQYPKRV